MPRFLPPATDVRFARLFKTAIGQTLLLENGVWSLVQNPIDSRVSAAEKAYRGGYEYWISNADAAALTAAGYTVIYDSDLFTANFEDKF